MPRLIQVVYDECRAFPAEIDIDPVNFIDHDASATNRGSLYFYFPATAATQSDECSIGMGITKICDADREGEIFLLCKLKTCRYVHIIRRKPQNTCNDRFVRSMSLSGFGKRTVQQDFSIDRCIL